MAAKKRFLSDPEIQLIRDLSPTQLEEHVVSLSTKGVCELLLRMATSYQLAARVANAAWGFFKTWTNGTGPIAEHEERLYTALQDYAPIDFPRHAGELETILDELRSLQFELEDLSADECREFISSRVDLYEQELKAQRAPARTPVAAK